MSCTHPIEAFRTASGGVVFTELARHGDLSSLKLACGQCTGCRLARASAWAARVMHEASLYENNCFLTLTYDDAHLPPDQSLRYRDVQLFLRRLRHSRGHEIRYYLCGEYGDITHRPHYHLCLFNVHFPDQTYLKSSDSGHTIFASPSLQSLWPHGSHSLGALNTLTAAYTARYVMQKLTGQAGERYYGTRLPPFNRMSLRPGIGARWLQKFHRDVFPADYLIVGGVKHAVPKYYDKLRLRQAKRWQDEAQLDRIEETLMDRQGRALLHQDDQTPERLVVKDIVTRARIANLTRTLDK